MYSYDHTTLMELGLGRWHRRRAPKSWEIERAAVAEREVTNPVQTCEPKSRIRLRLWRPHRPASRV